MIITCKFNSIILVSNVVTTAVAILNIFYVDSNIFIQTLIKRVVFGTCRVNRTSSRNRASYAHRPSNPPGTNPSPVLLEVNSGRTQQKSSCNAEPLFPNSSGLLHPGVSLMIQLRVLM